MTEDLVAHHRSVLALLVGGALAFTACGSSGSSSATTLAADAPIYVVANQAPESQIMAEVYAQILENKGFKVGRKDAVADPAAGFEKVKANEAQLTPAFTNQLLTQLGVPASATTTTSTTSTVAPTTTASSASTSDGPTTTVAKPLDPQLSAIDNALPQTMVVGDPSEAAITETIACSTAAVGKYSLKVLADLAKVSDQASIGGPASFEASTPWGIAGLKAAYGGAFSHFTAITDGDVAGAIAKGTVDCGVISSASAAIVNDGLLVLPDGKNLAPADKLVPLMTSAAATPGVLAALSQVQVAMSTDVLRALVVKSAQPGASYYVVAKQYVATLTSSGQQG